MRKQTLTVNAERFITQELKELEHTILSAQDRITALEFELLCELREQVGAQVGQIQALAAAVAQVDVLASSLPRWPANHYCLPLLVDSSSVLSITEGRHPVVEKMLKHALFVPNDTHMDDRDDRWPSSPAPIWRASPPTCARWPLIVLMAQMGPLSRPAPPASGWWTGCSPASGPATTWPPGSPPSWWR